MTAIPLEISFIVLLTMVNGMLAISETAIVSARKTRLQARSEDGDRRAQIALESTNRSFSMERMVLQGHAHV